MNCFSVNTNHTRYLEWEIRSLIWPTSRVRTITMYVEVIISLSESVVLSKWSSIAILMLHLSALVQVGFILIKTVKGGTQLDSITEELDKEYGLVKKTGLENKAQEKAANKLGRCGSKIRNTGNWLNLLYHHINVQGNFRPRTFKNVGPKIWNFASLESEPHT